MLKKLVLSLILAVFILGITLLIPKSTNDPPLNMGFPTFNFLKNTMKPETSIILTGDIMLGRSVMKESLSKNDPTYPFRNVATLLRSADIVIGNLETPIIKNCPTRDSGMIFCADPKMLSGLKFADISILNIANNHTKNYGQDGLDQTQNYLTAEKFDYVGLNNLVIKEVEGIRFGFLGFDFVSQKPKDIDYLLINNSKKQVDVLIVMVHWGNEYTSTPTLSQKSIATELIRAGADVISGSHPHWIQDIDTIDGKPIFYSLGNFVFDQPWSEETKKGLAIRLTYQKNTLIKIEKMFIYMKSFAQPEWVLRDIQ